MLLLELVFAMVGPSIVGGGDKELEMLEMVAAVAVPGGGEGGDEVRGGTLVPDPATVASVASATLAPGIGGSVGVEGARGGAPAPDPAGVGSDPASTAARALREPEEVPQRRIQRGWARRRPWRRLPASTAVWALREPAEVP